MNNGHTLTRRRSVIAVLVTLAMVILASATFFLGLKHGVEHMSITQATPDQLANAMKDDHFYSSYKENTLIISGSIDSVQSDHLITFKTSADFKTKCDFGKAVANLHHGDSMTVLSEGGSAKRKPNAVLLTSCYIL